jgi:hypothetical protein
VTKGPKLAATPLLVALAAGCGRPSGAVEVTPPDGLGFEPSVAVFHDGLAVSWYETRHGHGELYERPVDDVGRLGTEVRLTSGTPDAFEPDINPVEGTAAGDGFVVGWYEKGADNSMVPRLGLWSRSGTARWITDLSPRGRNTTARVRGDLVFAAWIEDEVEPAAGVWSGWWNLEGKLVVAPRRVGAASKTTYNLNAALADPVPGHGVPTALVVFDAQVGTRAQELHVLEDDGIESRVTRLTPDDGFASTYPDLALEGTRAAITWFDTRDGNEEVYLRVVGRQELARPDAIGGARVTTTKGHSIGAYTAWNGGRLGLAWCDDTEGQHEIYFAEFDTAGTPRGAAERLTDTRAGSLIPAIRAWRAGFALAWIEYQGGPDGHDVQSRSQVLLQLVR